MRALLRRDDTLTAALLVGFCLATSLVNPGFASVGTVFDLVRTALVPGILAMGVHIVLVSGGIDVSFTAIAAVAMYGGVKAVTLLGLGDHVAAVFAAAMVIGTLLGCVNAFFIANLRLPTLIVTLGTLSVFRGVLLTFVGTSLIYTLPAGMRAFARSSLLKMDAGDGSVYALPTAFLVLVLTVAGTWLLLNRSILGRCIFALGGSAVSADRIGVNVAVVQYFVYAVVGLLAGAAGVVHASLNRVANPFDLVGLELSVIAAVVLGGARITGGHGTITGTLLGVALIAVMNNTLILWGIPSTWQNVVVGLLILIGTGAPALRHRSRARAA